MSTYIYPQSTYKLGSSDAQLLFNIWRSTVTNSGTSTGNTFVTGITVNLTSICSGDTVNVNNNITVGGESLWKTGTTETALQPNRSDGSYNSGPYATILNGRDNTNTGTYSLIGGHQNNNAGTNATILGFNNLNSGNYTIMGGRANRSAGQNCFVFGTNHITTDNPYAFIGNGTANSATTQEYATIVNGFENKAKSFCSFIGNGGQNYVNGDYSSILNGLGNSATTQYTTVINGVGNIVNGTASLIGGGNGNINNGFYSTILNGINNYITNGTLYSAIIAGQGYTLSESYTVLVPQLVVAGLQTAPTGITTVSLVADVATGKIYKA